MQKLIELKLGNERKFVTDQEYRNEYATPEGGKSHYIRMYKFRDEKGNTYSVPETDLTEFEEALKNENKNVAEINTIAAQTGNSDRDGLGIGNYTDDDNKNYTRYEVTDSEMPMLAELAKKEAWYNTDREATNQAVNKYREDHGITDIGTHYEEQSPSLEFLKAGGKRFAQSMEHGAANIVGGTIEGYGGIIGLTGSLAGFVSEDVGNALHTVADEMSSVSEAMIEGSRPEDQNFAEKILGSSVRSIAMQVPMMGVPGSGIAAQTIKGAVMASSFGDTRRREVYKEAKKNGLSEDEAKELSYWAFGAEAGIETIGQLFGLGKTASRALHSTITRNLIKEFKKETGKEILSEAGTEFLQEGFGNVIDQMARGIPLEEVDYKQALQAGGEGALAAAVSVGGLSIAGAPRVDFVRERGVNRVLTSNFGFSESDVANYSTMDKEYAISLFNSVELGYNEDEIASLRKSAEDIDSLYKANNIDSHVTELFDEIRNRVSMNVEISKMGLESKFAPRTDAEGNIIFTDSGDGHSSYAESDDGVVVTMEDDGTMYVHRKGDKPTSGTMVTSSEDMFKAADEWSVLIQGEAHILEAKSKLVDDIQARCFPGIKVIKFENLQQMTEAYPEIIGALDDRVKNGESKTGAAAWIGNDTVLVNLQAVHSPKEIIETLWHEVGVHNNLRAALGDKKTVDEFLVNFGKNIPEMTKEDIDERLKSKKPLTSHEYFLIRFNMWRNKLRESGYKDATEAQYAELIEESIAYLTQGRHLLLPEKTRTQMVNWLRAKARSMGVGVGMDMEDMSYLLDSINRKAKITTSKGFSRWGVEHKAPEKPNEVQGAAATATATLNDFLETGKEEGLANVDDNVLDVMNQELEANGIKFVKTGSENDGVMLAKLYRALKLSKGEIPAALKSKDAKDEARKFIKKFGGLKADSMVKEFDKLQVQEPVKQEAPAKEEPAKQEAVTEAVKQEAVTEAPMTTAAPSAITPTEAPTETKAVDTATNEPPAPTPTTDVSSQTKEDASTQEADKSEFEKQADAAKEKRDKEISEENKSLAQSNPSKRTFKDKDDLKANGQVGDRVVAPNGAVYEIKKTPSGKNRVITIRTRHWTSDYGRTWNKGIQADVTHLAEDSEDVMTDSSNPMSKLNATWDEGNLKEEYDEAIKQYRAGNENALKGFYWEAELISDNDVVWNLRKKPTEASTPAPTATQAKAEPKPKQPTKADLALQEFEAEFAKLSEADQAEFNATRGIAGLRKRVAEKRGRERTDAIKSLLVRLKNFVNKKANATTKATKQTAKTEVAKEEKPTAKVIADKTQVSEPLAPQEEAKVTSTTETPQPPVVESKTKSDEVKPTKVEEATSDVENQPESDNDEFNFIEWTKNPNYLAEWNERHGITKETIETELEESRAKSRKEIEDAAQKKYTEHRDRFLAFEENNKNPNEYLKLLRKAENVKDYIDGIKALIEKHRAIRDDWASRSYKRSNKTVEAKDKTDAFTITEGWTNKVSVDNINEQRRANRINLENEIINKLQEDMEGVIGKNLLKDFETKYLPTATEVKEATAPKTEESKPTGAKKVHKTRIPSQKELESSIGAKPDVVTDSDKWDEWDKWYDEAALYIGRRIAEYDMGADFEVETKHHSNRHGEVDSTHYIVNGVMSPVYTNGDLTSDKQIFIIEWLGYDPNDSRVENLAIDFMAKRGKPNGKVNYDGPSKTWPRNRTDGHSWDIDEAGPIFENFKDAYEFGNLPEIKKIVEEFKTKENGSKNVHAKTEVATSSTTQEEEPITGDEVVDAFIRDQDFDTPKQKQDYIAKIKALSKKDKARFIKAAREFNEAADALTDGKEGMTQEQLQEDYEKKSDAFDKISQELKLEESAETKTETTEKPAPKKSEPKPEKSEPTPKKSESEPKKETSAKQEAPKESKSKTPAPKETPKKAPKAQPKATPTAEIQTVVAGGVTYIKNPEVLPTVDRREALTERQARVIKIQFAGAKAIYVNDKGMALVRGSDGRTLTEIFPTGQVNMGQSKRAVTADYNRQIDMGGATQSNTGTAPTNLYTSNFYDEAQNESATHLASSIELIMGDFHDNKLKGGINEAKSRVLAEINRYKNAVSEQTKEGGRVVYKFPTEIYNALKELGISNEIRFRLTLDAEQISSDIANHEQGVRFKLGNNFAMVTYFSGGGSFEKAIKGYADIGVEVDSVVADTYRRNHPGELLNMDIRDVNLDDIRRMLNGTPLGLFHASPVCKNFSQAKTNAQESDLDIVTAEATAKFIDEMTPMVASIENVKAYKNSKAYGLIIDAFKRNGYKFDSKVYNSADYGAATRRERLIVRASRIGDLPPPLPKTRPTNWIDRIGDLMTNMKEMPLTPKQKAMFNSALNKMGVKKIHQPIFISDFEFQKPRMVFANNPVPTITAKGGQERIVMPNGKAYEVTPRMVARLQGLPDSYELPKSKSQAHKIIGNGIPTELTKAVIQPLVDTLDSVKPSMQTEARWRMDSEQDINASETTRPNGRQKQAGITYPDASVEIRSLGDVRFSLGNKAREEAINLIKRKRPDLANEEEVNRTVDEIGKFDTPKKQKAALHWFIKGAIQLPEDAPKVTEAIGYSERAKGKANTDPMSYASPMAMIEALHEFEPKAKPIDPDNVPELSDKQVFPGGITTYLVQDDKQGQLAMREIINTHWGKDANPWCLLCGDGNGNLSDGSDGGYNAWEYWQHYSALPKRVAFKNGKLLAFMATDIQEEVNPDDAPPYVQIAWNDYLEDQGLVDDFEAYYDDFREWAEDNYSDWLSDNYEGTEQWWDRQDSSHDGIPLGNIPVPNDPYGRWADYELVNGEATRVSNYHKGIDGQPGYIEWTDSGNIYICTSDKITAYYAETGEVVWAKHSDFSKYYHSFITPHTDEALAIKAEAERLYRENSQVNQEVRLKIASDEILEAQRQYDEAARRIENSFGEVDIVKGDVRFAVRDVLKDDERKQAIKDLMAVTGRSEQVVKKWLEAEESLAKVILADDNVSLLDMQADDSVPSIWKNADYPQGTVEFSNICAKRLPFTIIYQRLQKEFPNTVFDAKTLNTIRETLKKNGVDVACAVCFVEDRRQLLGEIGKSFIDALKGKPVSLNDKQKVILEELAQSGNKFVPNLYDILTLDGMKELRKKHPAVAEAFINYNSARGQQSGRLFQAYSAYHREILKFSEARVRSINNNGGLRIFSFSDFEAHHLIDLVQVLTDCAAKGIKVQCYTKVPAFAKAMKDTGAKINRSLIPKGIGYVDADYVPKEGEAVSPNVINGKRLLLDTVEGIDVNDPDFFDSANNKNVGNIIIGINDEQSRIAMADPFVDYIIGFHSGQKQETRDDKGIGDWINYKNEQLEKIVSTDKDGKTIFKKGKPELKNAPDHGVNIYTNVLDVAEAEGAPIKTAKQFTERFIKECNSRGYIPRFYRFLNKSKDGKFIYTPGYHKFLVDFKLFNRDGKILPQEPVKPIFDNEFNKKILDDYVKDMKEAIPLDDVYEAVKDAIGLGEGTDGTIRLSIAAKLDSDYLDAINRGDMDTVQRMVREAAARAMPNTKVVGKDGLPLVVYHGTPQGGFTKFSYGRGGVVSCTESKQVAKAYAGALGNPQVYSVYVNSVNPYVIDMEGAVFTNIPISKLPSNIDINNYPFHRGKTSLLIDDFVNLCRRAGYDSVKAENIVDPPSIMNISGAGAPATNWYVGKDEEVGKIKSADPITYDDAGNIIPLSQRFNLNNPDIRFSITAKEDADYLDAVNRGDMKTAQQLVDKAAKAAGYDSPKLYHGTKAFGFTEVKTSGVEKGVDWSPFFAANKEGISASYVPYGKVREISSTMDEDAIEEARENAIEERRENISALVDDFRSLIDMYFSEWVFGQTDNSYLERLVEDANPEAGYGDGVYDVLSDIVYDTFYDYKDNFAEYEDVDDWSENSPEAQEIFSKISEIEGGKLALHRLEIGEEFGGTYQLYANLDNMFVVDGKGAAWNNLRPEGLPKLERYGVKDAPYKTRDVAEWARNNGYDGVIFKNIRDGGVYGRVPTGDVYAFFHPEAQIKSADPVTYDDNGNVIPLSQRFNPEKNDIRFSIGGIYTGSAADYANRSRQGGVDDGPSLHYVGTGEGQQVYGYGLYASNRRGVAESYAKQDADEKGGPHRFTLGGDRWEVPYDPYRSKGEDIAARAIILSNGDFASAHENVKQSLEKFLATDATQEKKDDTQKLAQDIDTILDEWEKDGLAKVSEYLYEQTFFTNREPGDESHLLNWYSSERPRTLLKNIRSNLTEEQANTFNKMYNKAYRSGPNGRTQAVFNQDIYEMLTDILGSAKEASEFLRDKCDIDGIKYPVDSYRGPIRDGNKVGWNYVSFRDDNIRVDHKWVDGEIRWRVNNITPDDVLSHYETPQGNRENVSSLSKFDRLRRKSQDLNISILRLEEKYGIARKDSVYYAEDRRYGKDEHQLRVFDANVVQPIIDAMAHNNVTHGELDAYLLAMHAKERNDMISKRTNGQIQDGSSITNAVAERILNQFDQEGKTDRLNAVAELVWNMNQNILSRLVSEDLMTDEQASTWRELSPHYVPLRNNPDDIEMDDRGTSLRKIEFKHAVGRETLPDSPFVYSIMQYEQALMRINKNNVRKKLAEIVRKHKELGTITDTQPTKTVYSPSLGQNIEVTDQSYNESQRDNIVQFKENGVLKYIELNGIEGKDIARAMTKSHLAAWPEALSAAQKVSRWMARTRTSWVPTFLIRNGLFDQGQVIRNMASDGFGEAILDFEKYLWSGSALKTAIKYYNKGTFEGELARVMELYVTNGGLIKGAGTEGYTEHEVKLRNRKGGNGYRGDTGIALLNSSLETATRLAVFTALINHNVSPEVAVNYSRDVTVNFNRKGEWTPIWNTWSMFSNASIQDLERTVRSITNIEAARMGRKGAGPKVFGRMIVLGFLLSLLYNAFDDEDEENTITEYTKKTNHIFRISKDKYVKLGVRGLWAWPLYFGQKIGDAVMRSSSPKDAALDSVSYLLEILTDWLPSNQIIKGESLGQTIAQTGAMSVAPTFIQPMMQSAMNKTFMGSDLRRRKYDRNAPSSYNGQNTTSTVYKRFAEWMNDISGGNKNRKGSVDFAPEDIKMFVDTLIGGIGNDFSNVISPILDAANNDMSPDRTLIVRDFVREIPDNSSVFYDALDEQTKLEKDYESYREINPKKARELYNKHQSLRLAKRLKKLADDIKKLRKAEVNAKTTDQRKKLEERRVKMQSEYLKLTRK